MSERLLVPLALAAAMSLPGCVAVAIPVLAGGTMVAGSSDEGSAKKSVAPPAQTATPSVAAPPAPPSAAAPATIDTPTPTPVAVSPIAPVALDRPLASLQLTGFDPAFALLAERSVAVASAQNAADEDEPAPLLSALLADPVALDGQREPCADGRKLSVLIDLDPAGAMLTPPDKPQQRPEHAAALAQMREAGVIIGWVSGLPITQTGAIRNALEQSGLDPRGEDVLLLAGIDGDRKQVLREGFGRSTCVIAIAGDERTDFDERYRYLRDPSVGAGLDRLIGEVWHLIHDIIPTPSNTGNANP